MRVPTKNFSDRQFISVITSGKLRLRVLPHGKTMRDTFIFTFILYSKIKDESQQDPDTITKDDEIKILKHILR